MSKKYKIRHTEFINGKKYDFKANSNTELVAKVAKKKESLCYRHQDMNVAEMADIWKSLKEPSVSEQTLKGYGAYLKRLESKKMLVKDVVQSDIQQWINVEKNKSKEFYKKYYTILHSIFELAVRDRMIPFNPVTGCKLPKGSQSDRRSITENERRIFLKACDANSHGLMFLIMLYCGLRNSEVRRLQGKHIDTKEKIIHVPGTKSKSAARDVPIPSALLFKLNGFRNNQYLFTTKDRKPVNKDRMTRWWKTIRTDMNKELGAEFFRGSVKKDLVAEDFTPYCLRHTYCTDLERAGIPITIASRLMGHSSIEITAKIYTHENDEALNSSRESLDRLNKSFHLISTC